jgi:DtxR family Mn-dependent transcriptional regulator
MDASQVAPALLECLDAVSRLAREDPPPSIAAVARRLGLAEPEARARLVELEALGLVRSAGAPRLSASAEHIALRLLRRHRLLERFLTDQLRLPWARVHEEAARLTPVLADDVADALAALLGDPAHCPHGNPIPAADGTLAAEVGTSLDRLRTGQAGIILRIEREEPELLRYLAALGLLPQTKIEVEEVAPFGGPLLVRAGSSRYALGRDVAARILVREV